MTFARIAKALPLAALCAVAVGCGGTDRSPEAMAASLRAEWEVQEGAVKSVSCISRGDKVFVCNVGVDNDIYTGEPGQWKVLFYRLRLTVSGDACWRAASTEGLYQLRGCLPA